MIRTFCDQCEVELAPEENVTSIPHRVKNVQAELMFEVIIGQKPTWNAGAYCKDCVFEAIKRHIYG